jgi:hypothetical protein
MELRSKAGIATSTHGRRSLWRPLYLQDHREMEAPDYHEPESPRRPRIWGRGGFFECGCSFAAYWGPQGHETHQESYSDWDAVDDEDEFGGV